MASRVENIVQSMLEDYSFIFDDMDAEVYEFKNYSQVRRYLEPYLDQITVDTINELPENIAGEVYNMFVDAVVEAVLAAS